MTPHGWTIGCGSFPRSRGLSRTDFAVPWRNCWSRWTTPCWWTSQSISGPPSGQDEEAHALERVDRLAHPGALIFGLARRQGRNTEHVVHDPDQDPVQADPQSGGTFGPSCVEPSLPPRTHAHDVGVPRIIVVQPCREQPLSV